MPLPFDAKEFAADWIAAWNSHDVERILAHYTETVVLTSPKVARVLEDPAGQVAGIDALRNYFGKALALFPNLKFTLIEVMQGLSSVVLYYENQSGTHTGEFMEFNSEGKVTRVVANYSV